VSVTMNCCLLQISVNGLELLCLLIDRFEDKFRSYVTSGKDPTSVNTRTLSCKQ